MDSNQSKKVFMELYVLQNTDRKRDYSKGSEEKNSGEKEDPSV